MIKDRKKKPFCEAELWVIDQKPGLRADSPKTNIYNPPISYRENALSLFYDKKPCFAVTSADFSPVSSDEFNKYLSRARTMVNMTDVFGVKWHYVEEAGGSITLSGNPRFTDVNEWKKVISIPDVDKWDWEEDAKKHCPDQRFPTQMTFSNGWWFERMISLMDFENAAMALVDDDQRDALNEMLTEMTEMGCKIVDNVCQYWPAIDGFMIHDDWGSQKSPFFSEEIAREVFLPHMKKFIDCIHEKGRYCGIHSCGHVEDRVGVFIDAGLDTWQMQTMNDSCKLYKDVGDKIVIQVTIPTFDINDQQACIKAAHDYVDTYCKPGKPAILASREALTSEVFKQELYRYSRKHYIEQ